MQTRRTLRRYNRELLQRMDREVSSQTATSLRSPGSGRSRNDHCRPTEAPFSKWPGNVRCLEGDPCKNGIARILSSLRMHWTQSTRCRCSVSEHKPVFHTGVHSAEVRGARSVACARGRGECESRWLRWRSAEEATLFTAAESSCCGSVSLSCMESQQKVGQRPDRCLVMCIKMLQ